VVAQKKTLFEAYFAKCEGRHVSVESLAEKPNLGQLIENDIDFTNFVYFRHSKLQIHLTLSRLIAQPQGRYGGALHQRQGSFSPFASFTSLPFQQV
jgi:hypothetical protein